MDKKDLYDKAKEAYYDGKPIMSDIEFDELEREIGLENSGYVGTHHQKSYTVRHPFIMGSLSKVQVKEDDGHKINWWEYQKKVMDYLRKSNGYGTTGWFYEITPKYDGCSWEAVIDAYGNLVSVSTRGDGEYGKDISVWFLDEWEKRYAPYIKDYYTGIDILEYGMLKYLVVRGECLVKKSVFLEKYSNEFTLPRSFVSGLLGQDWENTERQVEMRRDLSWVAYDFREVYTNGTIKELGYSSNDSDITVNLGNRPSEVVCGSIFCLRQQYEYFDKVRRNGEFPLDGFVVKPGARFRLQDGERTRQEDCVAVKFLPEIADAVVKGIEWNVGKTGEYYPTGILEDIILGGKKVNRVSLSNYGKVVSDNIGIGTRLKISLAGDIIPFVYKVLPGDATLPHGVEYANIPSDSYIDGIHLMKKMDDRDKMHVRFINSVNVIKPDGIGEKIADRLFGIWNTGNIIDFMVDGLWKESLDGSKSSMNIINAIDERKKTLTLKDIIWSMGYENCGEKNSTYLARKISGLNPDTAGIPSSILELGESDEFVKSVELYMKELGVGPVTEESDGKIPVILTGSPKECGYKSKAEFLSMHGDMVETTKWSECRILISDDLDSSSTKMKKARKLGIEIRRYSDF